MSTRLSVLRRRTFVRQSSRSCLPAAATSSAAGPICCRQPSSLKLLVIQPFSMLPAIRHKSVGAPDHSSFLVGDLTAYVSLGRESLSQRNFTDVIKAALPGIQIKDGPTSPGNWPRETIDNSAVRHDSSHAPP